MIRSFAALAALVALATALAAAASPPAPSSAPRRTAPSSRAHATPSPAAPEAAGSGAAFDLGVWTVHASSVDANFKTGEFSTPQKVVMTREGGDISADKANGNYKTRIVNLVGNVIMHDNNGDYGGIASAGGSQGNGPSTLTADRAEIDGTAKIYKAIGNVHYVQADTVVDADNGTLNDTTHDLNLQGNVHITQGTRKINAQSVVYNTITSKAHAQGDVTMEFPGQLHRGIATPRPINIPKNPISEPAATP